MGFGLKSKLKSVLSHKEYMPIVHPVSVEKEFDGKGYGDFKMAVGEAVVSVLKPLQSRVADLEKDKAYIDGIIKNNAEKAQYFANKTLRKVQKKVGFPERVR